MQITARVLTLVASYEVGNTVNSYILDLLSESVSTAGMVR